MNIENKNYALNGGNVTNNKKYFVNESVNGEL